MNKPIISVVIPAYNEEKNIAFCLKSIAKQSLLKNRYEVIVVDNGSTDKTVVIAKKYHAKVVTEKKKGYVHALNTGLNSARSPLIAVTDADSTPNSDWLEHITEVFNDNSHVGYITGTMMYVPTDFFVSLVNVMLNIGARLFNIGCGFHMAFRRDAWEKIAPFPLRLNFNVDAWIAFEIEKKGYKRYFIPHNWVKTSSRHITGMRGGKYLTKSMLNLVGLLLFNKTFYYEFGDVRE